MGRAYSDLTFTPSVRAVQTRMGSRDQYAFLDAMSDRGDALTPRETAMIRKADHFFQATVSETGWPYVQHRGGPVGFLKVLDPKTIAFADYRGNLHYQSVGNLERDDRIALIVIDQANRQRLKLLGRVRLVDVGEDDAVLAAVRDEGYAATVERAFVITIEGWDWNCPQHGVPRFTEAEVATLLKPLQEQVRRLRAQVPTAPRALGDGPLALRIAGIRQLTPTIRGYELVSADGSALPAVTAGSHLDVPVRLADGTPSTRRYSIASAPNRTDAWEIAVLREADGKGGSLAFHQDVALGSELRCAMPRNDFALEDGPHRAVLVAGGIGITPIKAMAHALAARGADFTLHYASRSRREAAFLGSLVESFDDRVRVHAGDEGKRLDVRSLLATLEPDAHLYVCGPARLIDEVRATAAVVGIDPARLHVERFAAEPARVDDRPLVVHLARSGKDVAVPVGTSVLDALAAASVHVPSSCRTGRCGTCATRVLDGDPDHRDTALTDAQRSTEGLMCICVSRSRGEALTLDL